MRSNTKKAKEIRTYYIKLEKILMELVNEEASELRLQLEQQVTRTESAEYALEFEKKKFAKNLLHKYLHQHHKSINFLVFTLIYF
jgi:hypothetical protein